MPEMPQAPRRKARWILYAIAALALMFGFFLVKRAAYVSAWRAYESDSSTGLSAVARPLPAFMARSAEGMLTGGGPNITRASSLVVQTQEFDRAVSQIPEIVRKHDGYFEDWKTHTRSHAGRWLEASLRVAAVHAEGAIAELRGFGDVQQESEASEDVGLEKETLAEKLQAERINLSHLEQVVRQHKGSLHDFVEAEEQLVLLRGKIRELEGQWKRLLSRGTYASISLTLFEERRAPVDWNPSRSFLLFRNASLEGVEAALSSVFFCAGLLLHYGPLILLWGAIAYGVFWLVRRHHRKVAPLHSSATP